MKILLVEAEVFRADRRREGQRDRHDKANRLFVILQKQLIKLLDFSFASAIQNEKKYAPSFPI